MVSAALVLLLLLPLLKPMLDGLRLGLLHSNHLPGGVTGSGLVGKRAVLIPVMICVVDQDKRLALGGLPRRETEGVGSSSPPAVLFAVDKGQARVRDAEATVAVDPLDFGGCGDVECLPAGNGSEVHVDQLRYYRHDGWVD